ncbi:MAG: glycosyltransferase [Thalassobaculaceae bacterium]|nr:glycosyltransferase [Thalassobaculaceae bacterium]
MSRRAVFVWELGDGLGHANRLLRIADRLRQDGVDCLFVVRNLEVGGAFVRKHGYPVLQAPVAGIEPIRGPDTNQPVSAGDILGSLGFASQERLGPFVDAWGTLFECLQADLVVSDYAPMANLALYGGPTKLVVIGDGFTLPPVEDAEFRPFREARPAYDERHMRGVVAAVQAARGRPAPDRLPALFAGDRHFVITLPELDQWAAFRSEPAIGPLDALSAPVDDLPSVDYFGYLSATYQFTDRLLTGLVKSGRTGSIFLRDSTAKMRSHWRAQGLTIHDSPRDMREEAGRSRAIVHHGGVGTCEQILAFGRPQVLVPRHFEQTSNARRLMEQGGAVALRGGGNFEVEHVAAALRAAAERPSIAAAARTMAETLATRPNNALETISVVCRTLLEGRRT